MPIIDVNGLMKLYGGKVRALDGVDFAVEEGEIFAFLGPNGAGKTTTIKVLITLVRPTAGSVRVDGLDVAAQAAAVRQRIGYAAQEVGLDHYASGRENLLLQGRLYHLPRRAVGTRVEELLRRFDLLDAADRLVSTYSGGMRKRLDLASALVHRPRVLFLDEPTVGLDPQSRSHVWDYVRGLRAEGVTVFLTTHYLEEADQLADHIAIIDHGHIVARGTPETLKDEVRGDRVSLRLHDGGSAGRAAEVLGRTAAAHEIQTADGTVHVRVERGGEALPELLRVLEAAGLGVAAAELTRPSLDDVFLRHTGRSLRDTAGEEAAGAAWRRGRR